MCVQLRTVFECEAGWPAWLSSPFFVLFVIN